MPGFPSKPNNLPLASSLPKVSFRRIPLHETLPLATTPAGVLDPQMVTFGFNNGKELQRPEHYFRYIEPIETDLKKQVEYDMDEQDQEWLDALNLERRKDQLDIVSYQVFEVIIDQLEKEWFDLMRRLPPKFPHSTAGQDGQNDSDDGEDTKCAICDDGECENSNAIVFCDGCNLAVHQDCYGIPYIPEGQWLCRKCTVSPDRAVSCILCPHEGGAFKQTTTGKWAHLLCAMWIPETGVSNPVYMEPIDSIERIPKARWKLQCYLCRNKVGACIQCENRFCFTAFHVTCARIAGLLIRTERQRVSHHHDGDGDDDGDDDSSDNENGQILRACCHKHLPRSARGQLKISFNRSGGGGGDDDSANVSLHASPFATPRTREHSTDPINGHSLPLISVSRGTPIQSNSKGGSKSARAYKKSYKAGPPLVPAYVVNRVLEYVNKINLRKKQTLVCQIAKYWSLKREARRGASLLKRLHLEPWTASSQNKEQTDAQKMKKLQFLKTLREDLERVRMLAELVRKREREKLRQAQLIRNTIVDNIFFPYHHDLKAALAKLQSLDRQGFFSTPVSRAQVPDYYDIIKQPMDWSTMCEKLNNKAYMTVQEFKQDAILIATNAMTYNKVDTPYHKAAAKILKSIPTIFADLEQIETRHQLALEREIRETSLPNQEIGVFQPDPEASQLVSDLHLEPSFELVKLLQDYTHFSAQDLLEIRGQSDESLPPAIGPKTETVSPPLNQIFSPTPTRQGPAISPVNNIVDDMLRQFYVLSDSADTKTSPPKDKRQASTSLSTARLKRKRQASETSQDAIDERRASRRLKGQVTELVSLPNYGARGKQTPETKPQSNHTVDSRTSSAAGAEHDAAVEESPEAPLTRHEEGTERDPETSTEFADEQMDKSKEGEREKERRLKRGQIPDEPKTLQVETVGKKDSFKRFNIGWVLPEGSKRGNRGHRASMADSPSLLPAAKALAPESSPANRRNSTNSNRNHATGNGSGLADLAPDSPKRPRSKTVSSLTSLSTGIDLSSETPKSLSKLPVDVSRHRSLRKKSHDGGHNDAGASGSPSSSLSSEDEGEAENKDHQETTTTMAQGVNDQETEDLTTSTETDREAYHQAQRDKYNLIRRERRAKERQERIRKELDGSVNTSENEMTRTTRGRVSRTYSTRDRSNQHETDDSEVDHEAGVSRRSALNSRKAKVKVPRTVEPSTTTSATTLPPLYEGGTLVWAKMKGYPHFPAVVVEEDDTGNIPTSVLEDKVKILAALTASSGGAAVNISRQPSMSTVVSFTSSPPPPSTTPLQQLVPGSSRNGETESQLILVQFYDKAQSWQWIQSNRIELMYEDDLIDQRYLKAKGFQAGMRKRVRSAYEEARENIEI